MGSILMGAKGHVSSAFLEIQAQMFGQEEEVIEDFAESCFTGVESWGARSQIEGVWNDIRGEEFKTALIDISFAKREDAQVEL